MAVKRSVKKKAEETAVLDTLELVEIAEQFFTTKTQAAAYAERQKTLRDRLAELVEQFGDTDSDGHIFLDLPREIDGFGSLKWEKRVSRSLDADKAEDMLKGKRLLKSCQTTITVLDESKIEALVFQGKITTEEWDEIFPAKEIRALKPVKA